MDYKIIVVFIVIMVIITQKLILMDAKTCIAALVVFFPDSSL